MQKIEEIRGQSVEELEANIIQLQKDLFELTNEFRLNKKSEKPHLMREKKREIARIKTIIREKR